MVQDAAHTVTTQASTVTRVVANRVQAVADRIRQLRSEGATLTAIADLLNEEEVSTATGKGHWFPATVRAVLNRAPG